MKKHVVSINFSIIFTLALCACLLFFTSNDVASAESIVDRIDQDVVEFYEKNIAGMQIISNLGKPVIDGLMQKYSLNENKLYAILMLKDLGGRTNQPQTIAQLSKMTDEQLLAHGKTLVKAYMETLSKTERAKLAKEFLPLLKK